MLHFYELCLCYFCILLFLLLFKLIFRFSKTTFADFIAPKYIVVDCEAIKIGLGWILFWCQNLNGIFMQMNCFSKLWQFANLLLHEKHSVVNKIPILKHKFLLHFVYNTTLSSKPWPIVLRKKLVQCVKQFYLKQWNQFKH